MLRRIRLTASIATASALLFNVAALARADAAPDGELAVEDEAVLATETPVEQAADELQPAEIAPLAKSAVLTEGGVATPPMWRIADEDTEIILVGTFHILPPDVQWRSPALGKAIDSADELWFEAEVDTRTAQAEVVRILKSQGFLTNGALSALLADKDSAKLQEVASSLGLPFAAVDKMRPWQAFLVLSVQLIQSKGFDPSAGLENQLLTEGRARGREFVFLETVQQQLGFFTSLKPAVEKSLLELTLRDWDKQAEEFDRLFAAWKSGDAAAIDEIMNKSMREEAPEVYAVLLKKRNEEWTARIKAGLDTPGRKLIAVGAAHLAGVDGVPAMLEAAGVPAPRYGLAANDNEPTKKKKSKKGKDAKENSPATEPIGGEPLSAEPPPTTEE